MVSTVKKNKKRKAQREAVRVKHQMYPAFSGDEEHREIAFRPIVRPETDPPRADPTLTTYASTGLYNGPGQEAEQRDQLGLLGQRQYQNGV